MIDFILFSFVVGVFAGGFWCGNKYGNVKSMFSALSASISGWLK
jgi:hypothetical protein